MERARRQPDLPAPGMARVERPEIEEPAEDLRAITGEIATLNERKRNAQAVLLEKCAAAGITIHKYLDADGIERVVKVISTPKARVERVKGAKKSDDAPPPEQTDDVTVQ